VERRFAEEVEDRDRMIVYVDPAVEDKKPE
jgi:hypothetical protein